MDIGRETLLDGDRTLWDLHAARTAHGPRWHFEGKAAARHSPAIRSRPSLNARGLHSRALQSRAKNHC